MEAQGLYAPDYWRHRGYLDPQKVVGRFHLIGAGASGSWMAMALAKLGLGTNSELWIWDGDVVEEHNIPSQVYGPAHINRNKAQALSEVLWESTQIAAFPVSKMFDPREDKLGGYVFSLVDSIDSRRLIWERVKDNPLIRALIDIRLGLDIYQIYTYLPGVGNPEEDYEATLVTNDNELEDSPCDQRMVISTVLNAVGMAVHILTRILRGEPVPRYLNQSMKEPHLYIEA